MGRSGLRPDHAKGASRGLAPWYPRLGSALFRDGFHDARDRAVATARSLHLLADLLGVGGNRRHRELRLHEDDLVAGGLEIVEQLHRGLTGRVLEIMKQHNAS